MLRAALGLGLLLLDRQDAIKELINCVLANCVFEKKKNGGPVWAAAVMEAI